MRRQVLALLPQLARAQQAVGARAAIAGSQPWVRFFADDANLKKTALYDFHVAHGGERAGCVRASGRCGQCRIALMTLLNHQVVGRTQCATLALLIDPTPPHHPTTSQAKWCHLLAGPCPSSTRILLWRTPFGAEITHPCLMCLTCAALP